MITTYLNGRLGNNLFQYVFCKITSLENDCNFYIPKNKEESDTLYNFCSSKLSLSLEESKPSNPHYWLGDKIFNIDYGTFDDYIINYKKEFNFELTNVKEIKNGTLLNGFYQTDSYMIEYEDIIINDWLKINDTTISNSSDIIGLYPPDKYCYIHFRGGDYKNIPEFFLPMEYYKKSIERIKEINHNINFLVISDDIESAKEYFPDFKIISNSEEIDFFLLTQSKYSIIPNSSFSWWGLWLNKNKEITIAPNNWFNYNGYYGKGFFPYYIKTNKFQYL